MFMCSKWKVTTISLFSLYKVVQFKELVQGFFDTLSFLLGNLIAIPQVVFQVKKETSTCLFMLQLLKYIHFLSLEKLNK